MTGSFGQVNEEKDCTGWDFRMWSIDEQEANNKMCGRSAGRKKWLAVIITRLPC